MWCQKSIIPAFHRKLYCVDKYNCPLHFTEQPDSELRTIDSRLRTNDYYFILELLTDYKFPLSPCSLSIASNKALKLPFPKLLAPLR